MIVNSVISQSRTYFVFYQVQNSHKYYLKQVTLPEKLPDTVCNNSHTATIWFLLDHRCLGKIDILVCAPIENLKLFGDFSLEGELK